MAEEERVVSIDVDLAEEERAFAERQVKAAAHIRQQLDALEVEKKRVAAPSVNPIATLNELLAAVEPLSRAAAETLAEGPRARPEQGGDRARVRRPRAGLALTVLAHESGRAPRRGRA